MASKSIVSNAVHLVHANQQLVDQVARLKTTVSELDAEIIRNRATIAAQALRIQELERELQALRAAHRTVDPRPVHYVVAGSDAVNLTAEVIDAARLEQLH